MWLSASIMGLGRVSLIRVISVSKEILKQYYLYAGDDEGEKQYNDHELEWARSGPDGEGDNPGQELEGEEQGFEESAQNRLFPRAATRVSPLRRPIFGRRRRPHQAIRWSGRAL